jgi:hypothetical protein
MQDILEQLYSYAENQSKPSDDLLLKIERETHLKTLSPRMLSGHLQGHLLTLLSILKQPKTILEINCTFFSVLFNICTVKTWLNWAGRLKRSLTGSSEPAKLCLGMRVARKKI